MVDKKVYFKRGYKYQLSRPFSINIKIYPDHLITSPFITLDSTGLLIIHTSYAWNGASGLTWDSLNSMRGSLVHDAIYQLIRLCLLDIKYKQYADQLLHDLCTEDGMYSWRADYWRWAVLKFGMNSCRPSAEPKEEVAPCNGL